MIRRTSAIEDPANAFIPSADTATEVPRRAHFHRILTLSVQLFPFGYMNELLMDSDGSTVARRASEAALAFGALIRSRRKALKMRQDQVALATGVGRRFLIELEAGKPTCQLGRSLLVAEALGLRSADVPASSGPSAIAITPDLPDLPDLSEQVG